MYRIYAKFKGQKTFKALDLSKGNQVNNLIYATIIREEELEKVKKIIEDNSDVEFEIRKVNQ